MSTVTVSKHPQNLWQEVKFVNNRRVFNHVWPKIHQLYQVSFANVSYFLSALQVFAFKWSTECVPWNKVKTFGFREGVVVEVGLVFEGFVDYDQRSDFILISVFVFLLGWFAHGS